MAARFVVRRKKQASHEKLMDDYFGENPMFGARTFRRWRVAKDVEAHCPYLVQKEMQVENLVIVL